MNTCGSFLFASVLLKWYFIVASEMPAFDVSEEDNDQAFDEEYEEEWPCVHGLPTGRQYNPDSPFFSTKCLCDYGWKGEHCNKSVSNICGNNGEELDGKCRCNTNYTGARCKEVLWCDNGQQQADGRCVCKYGWRGDFCNRIICTFGEVAGEANQTCICGKRYSGPHCDECAAKDSSSPPPECLPNKKPLTAINPAPWKTKVFIAVVVAVAAIAAVGICFVVVKFFRCCNSEDEDTAQETMPNAEPEEASTALIVKKSPNASRSSFSTSVPAEAAARLQEKINRPRSSSSSRNGVVSV